MKPIRNEPTHQCVGTDGSIHCHQRIQAFQNKSSPRNRKRETIRFAINKWMYPSQAHSKCFDNSSGIVFRGIRIPIRAFRIQTNLNVIADSISRIEAIFQEMSLKGTTFQLMQQWAGQLEIDMMASPKTGK